MSCNNLTVGSVVRAKRGAKRCRAMVATVPGQDLTVTGSSVCLLWEPIRPVPISGQFWIAPKSIQPEREQEETTIDVGLVEELLPFETTTTTTRATTKAATATNETTTIATTTSGNNAAATAAAWKEKGDQLLRLGDASAATPFYEKALSESSSVSIGGSIVVSEEGFPRIAEVDCIDDDDGERTIDVTLVHNEEERTIRQSAVLLSIMENDADHLQERILLNLARCMLQLADLDATNRPKYLKSAVLAATLVLTLSSHRQPTAAAATTTAAVASTPGDAVLPGTSETALVLRCKAYGGLSKWKNALSDARQLVARGTDPEQGKKLFAGIERKKAIRAKTDKKLAKDICRLVQSATAANEKASMEPTTSVSKITSKCSSRSSRRRRPSPGPAPPSSNPATGHLPSEPYGQRMHSSQARRIEEDDSWVSSLVRSGFAYCILPVVAAVLISSYFRNTCS